MTSKSNSSSIVKGATAAASTSSPSSSTSYDPAPLSLHKEFGGTPGALGVTFATAFFAYCAFTATSALQCLAISSGSALADVPFSLLVVSIPGHSPLLQGSLWHAIQPHARPGQCQSLLDFIQTGGKRCSRWSGGSRCGAGTQQQFTGHGTLGQSSAGSSFPVRLYKAHNYATAQSSATR